jgi:hypothetical protein
MKLWKKLFFVFLLGVTAHSLGAQVSFEASLSSDKVLLEGTLEVSFTLRNSSGKDFEAPAFNNFTVLSGPNQATRTTRINGRQSTEISISYILKPTRTGTFTINPATVTLNTGRKRQTQPLKVEVIPGKSQAEAEKSPVAMLRAEPDRTEAYPGQQIILDYKIYVRSDYFKEGHQITNKPDLSGFYFEELNWYRSSKTILDGVEYTVLNMARLALFPQRTGEVAIEPLSILIDVQERSPRNRFGLVPLERKKLESNPVVIQVNPLPEGAPPSFTGAVGTYSFQAAPNRTDLTTDDAVTFTLTIQGDGDPKRIQIPPLIGVDTFEVFDPNIVAEQMQDNRQGRIQGIKSIEYALTPKGPGDFRIPIEFTYFDVDSSTYVTLTEGPYLLQVKQGEGTKTKVNLPEESIAESGPLPLVATRRLHPRDRFFWGSPLFWSLSAVPFLVMGLGLLQRRRQDAQANQDPLELKRKAAQGVAQQRLTQARVHLQQADARPFYEAINQALLGYFHDKLEVPLSELGPSKLQKRLEEHGFSPSLIERSLKVVKTCEMALYAGMGNAEAMQETYSTTEQLLVDLEGSGQ